MEELESKNNVIPLPKEKEYTAIIGQDDQVKAFIVHKKQNHLGVNWVACYQTALEWLAKQSLPQEQYRVMIYLMSQLDFENFLKITQNTIAKELGMKQANVSRALKGLMEKDVIITGPKVGAAKTYRLNPRMAYKGKNPKPAIIEYDQLRKMREESQKPKREYCEDCGGLIEEAPNGEKYCKDCGLIVN